MGQTIQCAGCQVKFRLPADSAGKKFRCPKCGESIRVPTDSGSIFTQAMPAINDDDPAGAFDVETIDRSALPKPATPNRSSVRPASPRGASAPVAHREDSFDLASALEAEKSASYELSTPGPAFEMPPTRAPANGRPSARGVNGANGDFVGRMGAKFIEAGAATRLLYAALPIFLVGLATAFLPPLKTVGFGLSILLALMGVVAAVVGLVWALGAGFVRNPAATIMCFVIPSLGGYMMGEDIVVVKKPLGIFFRGVLIFLMGICVFFAGALFR